VALQNESGQAGGKMEAASTATVGAHDRRGEFTLAIVSAQAGACGAGRARDWWDRAVREG